MKITDKILSFGKRKATTYGASVIFGYSSNSTTISNKTYTVGMRKFIPSIPPFKIHVPCDNK